MEKMQYLIYKTTNLANGKIYVGAHATKNMNDGYMGSGIAIKKAIRKYGKENFSKEIISICCNEDEMWNLESEIVDVEFVSRVDTYNIITGGRSGCSHSDETKRKISQNNARYWKHHKKTQDHIEKHRLSKTGSKRPECDKIKISNTMLGVKKPRACCVKCRKEEAWISIKRNHKNCDMPKQEKTYKHRKRECPWCGVTGHGPNMTRYHFDKCKWKRA